MKDLNKLTSKQVKERDQALYLDRGADATFVKKHNDRVIETTIKKHELNMSRKRKDYVEQIAERSDAVASYLKSNMAASGYGIEKYLSASELARLRGEKRLQKIRTLMNGKKVIEFTEL